jgi:hypothetical protein
MDNLSYLFLITSCINIYKGTIYTPSDRYNQTINTINSIKKNFKNYKIIVLEGSEDLEKKINFENTEVYRSNVIVSGMDKSIGESYLLIDFLNSENFMNIKFSFDIIFKMSGRYSLVDNFNIENYKCTDKITIRQVNIWNDPNYKRDPKCKGLHSDNIATVTVLFSWPPKLTEFIINQLKIITKTGEIEQNIFYKVDTNLLNIIEYLGVTGNQSPNGLLYLY